MGLQKFRADQAGDKGVNGSIPWYANWMGGPTLALVRDCPCANADISPRTVYVTGEALTWTSLPASCRVKGKNISGYLTCDENRDYVFHAYTEQNLTYKGAEHAQV